MLRLLSATLLLAPTLAAQSPLRGYSDAIEARYASDQPEIRYAVTVDPADRTGYAVEMRIGDAPDTLRLAIPIWAPGAYRVAMFARNVRDLTVRVGAGGGGADGAGEEREVPVARVDSSTWRAVVGRGAEAVVRYRIAYPTPEAPALPNNRAFLRETGALLDGPATYLYLAGRKLVPAHVTFRVPDEWRIATGLVPTADPRTFFAPSYDVLIDSPVLAGELHRWRFEVDGVPHTIAWWLRPDAPAFDTAAFAATTERAVREAIRVFGRPPYREYTFLFVDGPGGGLEHLNSTTIGISSAALARDPRAAAGVTAHEFFHLWNVKRVRPVELGPFDYQRPVRTTGLWWSEGVTDFFADAILRRAGVASEEEARDALAANIESWLNNPARTRISPERSSYTAWDTPAGNQGYGISYYLQGALLGELLEITIRDSTRLRRGMDDVMREMLDRYAGERGFTAAGLERTVSRVCGCDLSRFFARHVRGAAELELDRWLASLGWRLVATRAPAADSAGHPLPDLRVGVLGFAGYGSAGGVPGRRPRLSVSDPTSAWGRAGLLTGDELVSVNDRPVADGAALRAALAGVKVGDRVRVAYLRDGATRTAEVLVGGYERTRVRIEDLPAVSRRQRQARSVWLKGPPAGEAVE